MLRKDPFPVLLILVLMGFSVLSFDIQPIKASGTIYVRANGTIDPDTAPILSADNVTYTFTADIYDAILVERSNIIIDGNGYTVEGRYTPESKGIDLTGRSNITIKNMAVQKFYYGVWMERCSNNSIFRNTITDNNYGIFWLSSSQNNSIYGNMITNNWLGIWLYSSHNNSIHGNTITANNKDGLSLKLSSNNSIYANTMTVNNGNGFWLFSSHNNSIHGNTITANNGKGIWMERSSNNSIHGNTITNNSYGIWLFWCSDNVIFHNNFENNNLQVQPEYSINIWDCGYPCGGNYWSDYTDVDQYSGVYQNETGSDEIWDHPYVIDENNQDNYPIVPEFPSLIILPLFMMTTLLMVIGLQKKKKQI